MNEPESELEWLARIVRDLQEMQQRHSIKDAAFARQRLSAVAAEFERLAKLHRRKPPEAGLAVTALPPRGPLPLEGGAEVPLD